MRRAEIRVDHNTSNGAIVFGHDWLLGGTGRVCGRLHRVRIAGQSFRYGKLAVFLIFGAESNSKKELEKRFFTNF